ncbi:MAG: Sec-independent protein translocase subunit TatA [Candidatus Nanopelagicales bacterium]|jgi:sec-independent protein translocase protein TatA
MPFNMKPWEFLIIVALILLLFGAKRLPDAARGLGRSLRIFKAETKALHDDDGPDAEAAGTDSAGSSTAQAPLPPAPIEPSPASSSASAPSPRPERTES